MKKQLIAAASAISLAITGAALGASAASGAARPASVKAAAPQLTYSGSAEAKALDLTVLGTNSVHVAEATLAASQGAVNSDTSPRSFADAANLQLGLFTGNPPSAALLAHTHQEAPPDNTTPVAKTVVPLHIPGLLDLGVSTAASQARWASDGDCLPSGASVDASLVSTADAELLGVAGLSNGLLKLPGTISTAQNTRLDRTGVGQPRAVTSTAIGSAASVELFNSALRIQVAKAPVLTATATGKANGAKVTWDAPLITINGSPLTVNDALIIKSPTNAALSVELTLGDLIKHESVDGTAASADATLLHLKIKLLGITIVQADLFPMSVSATAPVGGVVCPIDSLIDTDGDGLPDVDENSGDLNPAGHQPTDPLNPDTDGDGINDGDEVHGTKNTFTTPHTWTDPNNPDTDGDGLTDGQEVTGSENGAFGSAPTNPNDPDTDGDTLKDGDETSGASNAFDPGTPTNPSLADTDNDGLKDNEENANHTDPNDADTDNDGLSDGDEVHGTLNPFNASGVNTGTPGAPTDPTKADTDGDGLKDGQEIPSGSATSQNTSFNKAATNPNAKDTDGDGLDDQQEETGSANTAFGSKHTDPNLADSDHDGLTDGQETSGSQNTKFGGKATDPLISDTDGDGLGDGEEELASLSKNGHLPGQNVAWKNEATDPLVKDTDKGSVPDGVEELASGTNPNDPSDDVATPFAFNRLAGSSRYETSAKVALTFGTATEAILASGESTGYADALTGNYYAGTRNAPMLLTRKGSTPAVTVNALRSLGVTRVYVMGGPAAITSAQVDNLRSLGFSVIRLEGHNRYDTNAAVIAAGGDSSSDTAIVATGQDFPDALASGPLSYNEGMPLALTKPNDIPDAVVAALVTARVKHVLITGGTAAVGPAVVSELANAGIDVTSRFAGVNRAQTSRLIAEYAIATFHFSKTALDVASGAQEGTGADALSGSALAGKTDRPLLITASASNPDDVITFLKAHADTLFTGTIFGGTGAVTQANENLMEKTVNDNRP